MIQFATKVRGLASTALLAAALGVGVLASASPVEAVPAVVSPPLAAGVDVVPVRQDFSWFIPGWSDHDNWDDDWRDDDQRDRHRSRARARCLDRDPLTRLGRWIWNDGHCQWQNARPER